MYEYGDNCQFWFGIRPQNKAQSRLKGKKIFVFKIPEFNPIILGWENVQKLLKIPNLDFSRTFLSSWWSDWIIVFCSVSGIFRHKFSVAIKVVRNGPLEYFPRVSTGEVSQAGFEKVKGLFSSVEIARAN